MKEENWVEDPPVLEMWIQKKIEIKMSFTEKPMVLQTMELITGLP